MFMSLAQQPRKEEKQEGQIYYCKFPKSKIVAKQTRNKGSKQIIPYWRPLEYSTN